MRKSVFWGLILGLPALLSAGDKLQRLNVKTGLWEVSNTRTMSGEMPVPAGLLERMTPEQRARMEARLKEGSAGQTTTTTYKSCVTQKDLDDGTSFGEDQGECTKNVISSTSSKAQVHMVCAFQGIKGEGTVEVQALSSESTRGSVHMTASGNGRTMNSDSTFTAKWIGTNCGDVH